MHFTSTVYIDLFFRCLVTLKKRTLFPPPAEISASVAGYNTTHVSACNLKNFMILM